MLSRRKARHHINHKPVLRVEQLEDRMQPSASGPQIIDPGTQAINQIDHFVVIYQENWSFDALYSQFPGANGAPPGTNANQVDKNGVAITNLPTPSTDSTVPGAAGLPDQTYNLANYIPNSTITGDIVHRYYTEQLQIDNGAIDTTSSTFSNDKFLTYSDNKSLVLSQFDATNLPEGLLAQQYSMDDNFFHAAYGGSFLNHQFLVAAAPPQWNQPIPTGFQSSYDPTTKTIHDNNLTIDGKYDVNTTFAADAPHPPTAQAKLLNPINDNHPFLSDGSPDPTYTPTIGDRLDDAGVSWKWYSGGWNDALAGHADPLFQFHHQPFGYYANFAPYNDDGTINTTNLSQAHLQDEQNFFNDLSTGDLPAVSFIKPLGPDNEHPGYTNLIRGQQHVADIVHAIQNSADWAHTAIIITYDENGGRYDHVSAPMRDQWGDGVRVPAIVVSPYAKKGYVDHTQHDTLSILKTIEQRYDLQPLNQRDAGASSLASNFQLKSQASIGNAYVQPDADNPGKFTLVVQGTEGDDKINISLDGGNLHVTIKGDKVDFDKNFAQAIDRIEIYGQGGSDKISIDPAVTTPAFVFGGAGNDTVHAGGGATVVVGGSGRDKIFGGAGRSILIGGTGHDEIHAGAGDALLIAGSTKFDANIAALKALMSEWNSTDAYPQRVAFLTGGATGGKNGKYLLDATTVFTDKSEDELTGGAGMDLFFAHLSGKHRDDVDAVAAGETVVNI
jgi:phospholipase C